MRSFRPARSLRIRLLVGTLIWIAATIAIAGWGLAGLFRQHVAEQFRAGMVVQLDQLTANLAIDQAGQPFLSAPLSDPRLRRPFSGVYWQVDRLGSFRTSALPGVLRSRSLWDDVLTVPEDVLIDGEIHEHQITTADEAHLGVVERIVSPAEQPEQSYRLIVAATTTLITEPVGRFYSLLAWSLGALCIGLLAAAIAQVFIGLRPLDRLRRELAKVRQGTAKSIEGDFPLEVQPLVDDFNDVLSHNARAYLSRPPGRFAPAGRGNDQRPHRGAGRRWRQGHQERVLGPQDALLAHQEEPQGSLQPAQHRRPGSGRCRDGAPDAHQ